MPRYFLEIAFNGTHFHGWQSQLGIRTVQDQITTCIRRLLPDVEMVVGCGRTDTGVHASQYFLHFDTTMKVPEAFLFKLNQMCGQEIAIKRVVPVSDEHHARYSATLREYQYHIATVKSPFNWEFTNWVHQPLSVEKMADAARCLLEYSNFSSFERTGSGPTNSLCKIYRVNLTQSDTKIVFTIAANRFLRNMVRSIVGTLINVGRGKTSMDEFVEIIEARDRRKAGKSALACGLFLSRVEYPFITQNA